MQLEKILLSFRNYIHDDLAFQIIMTVLVFLGFMIIAKTLSYISSKVLKPLVKKTTGDLDDRILALIQRSSFRLLILLGGYIALGYFRSGFHSISIVSSRSLIQSYPVLMRVADYTENVLFILLVIQVLISSTNLIYVVFDWYAEKIHVQENKDLGGSLIPLLKKTTRLLLTCAAIIIILSKFNVNISAFIVSLGVGSLAIALAAQDTLSNMISGFIIMSDRPFRIGDRIKIGNDIFGDVEGIGIRSTKILDFDKNVIIVPNNDIVKSRIINLTYPSSVIRVVIELTLPFGVDLPFIKEKLVAIAKADPDVDPELNPEVYLVKFGETGLEFQLTVRTLDYTKAFDLRCRIRENIYMELQKDGIELAYPHRIVSIENNTKTEPNKN